MPRKVIIGRASQWSDGSVAPVEVEGHRIALCKVAGKFHALDDHCPHAGSTLALGTLHDAALECPRHEFLWCVVDGRPYVKSMEPVPTFKAWVEGDDVVMEMPDQWPEPAHWKRHPKREELRRRYGYAATPDAAASDWPGNG